MIAPSLLCGCETWTHKVDQIRRTEAAKLQFLKWVASYTLKLETE
jgi:hypothetical protein